MCIVFFLTGGDIATILGVNSATNGEIDRRICSKQSQKEKKGDVGMWCGRNTLFTYLRSFQVDQNKQTTSKDEVFTA
jgi:hypothetical protein